MINLPSSEVTSVLYDFERFQKQCYTCQRLTHEQEKCSLFGVNAAMGDKKQEKDAHFVSEVVLTLSLVFCVKIKWELIDQQEDPK